MEVGKNPIKSGENIIEEWGSVIRTFFGCFNGDISSVKIPEYLEEFSDAIVMPGDITCQRLYEKAREVFGCDTSVDLMGANFDRVISSSRPRLPYAARIRKQNIHCSCGICGCDVGETLMISDITLPEFFLLILRHYKEFGSLSDEKVATICGGSYLSNGGIPVARSTEKGIFVSWTPGFRKFSNNSARFRKVVINKC